jgi:predicted DNA-binding transcriptional regulator
MQIFYPKVHREESNEKLSRPDRGKDGDYLLKGTTLRVYRWMYRQGRPVGIHEVQRALALSSPSVAEYHIRKLVQAELVRERINGYLVDRVVFENLLRIRRMVIPLQATYVAFFGAMLVLLFALFRPSPSSNSTGLFVFALVLNLAAVSVFSYETYKTVASSL